MNNVTGNQLKTFTPSCCQECPYHFILPLRKNPEQRKVKTYYCLCKIDSHFIPIEIMDQKRYHCSILDGEDNIQVKDKMSW